MGQRSEKPLVSFDVSFGDAPPQGMVTPLCQSLCELCRPILGDDDAAARLRLCAHELLENVVKYSGPGACAFVFELHAGTQGPSAVIRTSNVPNTGRLGDVEERLSALTAARDPLEHYDSIIAASAQEPAGSGLGLARIHAETEYRLGYQFDGANLIITATGEVWLRKAAP